MNLLDLLVLLLLLLGLVAGARAGFLAPVLGLGGAVAFFGLALLLTTIFREALVIIEQPLRAFVTLAGLATFVLVGEAMGTALGSTMSHSARGSLFRPFDAVGGAVVGAAHVVLLVWLVGGMLATGMAPGLTALTRDSLAVRVVASALPPPTMVAGRLVALIDTTDLPPLFAGFEPAPAPPVDLPADAEARELAESALASTARISSSGCGTGLSVGSGFFVSATHAVTNAHIIAGSTETTVTLGGSAHAATVVAFDADADLALLHVPGVRAAPLQLSASAPARGTTGVGLGYPGGADLTVTPAAATAVYDVGGPNIYGEGVSQRSVVEMRANIQRGNSGGPLVTAPGVVGAVIFGASRTSSDIGYAIGAGEAIERIGPSIGSTSAVDTGTCL